MKKIVLMLCSAIFAFSALAFASCGETDVQGNGKEPTDWETEEKTYVLACLGDSITYGIGASDPDLKYTSVLEEETEFLESVQCVGQSGAMIGLSPTAEMMNHYAFVNRYKQIKKDTDIIFVFGGTNDYGFTSGDSHGVPLGKEGDDTAETFYGALEVLIDGLQADYPNAMLLFATPLQRDDEWCKESPENAPYNLYGNTLSEYRDAILYACEKNGIECLDLYHLDGMQLSDDSFKDHFSDGLHPNDEGHRLIAQAVADRLAEMLG